ncbi:MAG: Zn-ribbon domain-containing OB-fold protein [Dehalococcoidia bacterium]
MTTDAYAKPLPYRTTWSAPFWDALRDHRFLIQRCAGCDTPRFPPKPICSQCLSEASRDVEVSGAGTVYSYTVVHRGAAPVFLEEGPYVIALVDLDEGVRVMSNLVGCDLEAVEVGMPVRLRFEDVTPEVTLYRFEPA